MGVYCFKNFRQAQLKYLILLFFKLNRFNGKKFLRFEKKLINKTGCIEIKILNIYVFWGQYATIFKHFFKSEDYNPIKSITGFNLLPK